jgi:hypothetical protein
MALLPRRGTRRLSSRKVGVGNKATFHRAAAEWTR